MKLLLLLISAVFAMNQTGGPHYRDNNENGALDKDSWADWNGLWRSFLRVCHVPESSSFILQGLRDKDGVSIINRYNFFFWSQWRRLPTEAGSTAADNTEWLGQKLKATQDAVGFYEQGYTENSAKTYGPEGKSYAHAAEKYSQLKERAEAALPLLERVHAYYTRKAWVESLFAYIRGSHTHHHTEIQYIDHSETVHNYHVVETESNNSQIVFKKSSVEECEDCPRRLVLSEQFANKHRITGTDEAGKPEKMYLYYNIENGWRVHYTDERMLFNNRNVTVKFQNYQDGMANQMGGQGYY